MAETPILRALISVSDKTGLIEFAQALARHKVRLLSTGGSARALKEAGLAVTEVSAHTGFPEIMDGRVKTLHPTIHGGVLARRDNEKHRMQMESHDIAAIDMVVVNLYPFAETVAKGADYDECIENIDIGGPALIRAAAKNHDFVTIVTDPSEYAAVIAEMDGQQGQTGIDLRKQLARKAYARTAAYDAMISAWLARQQGEQWPEHMALPMQRVQSLRYGENPHQQAALYAALGDSTKGIAQAKMLQGKELSYNNINDADAAYGLVSEFDAPTVVIVKHANPCGVASNDDLTKAWENALACDPVSAFGGIVAINRPLDAALASKMATLFLEVVMAPSITAEALAIFQAKPNVRLLEMGGLLTVAVDQTVVKSIAGGYLVQSQDNGRLRPEDLKVVTKRQPSDGEMADLLFAWKVAKHVKSNAIIYVRDQATVGVGAGQMSRVDSARIAAHKAQEHAGCSPSVVASDAFFPFADGLMAAVGAGATAAIQPGGSMRDAEVIAAADEAGIAMVFTGMRHFRH